MVAKHRPGSRDSSLPASRHKSGPADQAHVAVRRGSKESSPRQPNAMAAPHNSSLAQVSFAPATKTTVVTTTTTTTTSLAPIFIRGPRHLQELDPETYPLAASPTPSSLKKLKFRAGEHNISFDEDDDAPADSLRQYLARQQQLQESNGILRTESTSIGGNRPILREPIEDDQILRTKSSTPMTSPDGAEMHSFLRRNSRPSSRRRRHVSERLSHPFGPSSTKSADLPNARSAHAYATPTRRTPSLSTESSSSSYENQGLGDEATHLEETASTAEDSPSADSDAEPFSTFKAPEPRRRSAGPRAIDTSPQQEASLPSPSLSPTTAAANLHRLDAAGDATNDFGRHSVSANEDQVETDTATQMQLVRSGSSPTYQNNSLMNIPNMLDTFETLPDQMKTWMVYQMLRRCSKTTLHFVSDIVAPTLKCDFMARLPLELSHLVVSNLDFTSLCNAAQVNRNWRKLIDSNEGVWRTRIEKDGYKIMPGEVEQAIEEGWGWQFPQSDDQFDVDLRDVDAADRPGSRRGSTHSDTGDRGRASSRKRKAVTAEEVGPSKRRKQPRGQRTLVDDGYDPESGPFAAADVARKSHPDTTFGLPQLRNMHLFKSIYRRHHTVRMNWLDPNVKPQHTAFRAHERHVVTCLQFDNDKILTGSDDANIDIYDTKTGASLMRLQGHDGGVWALEYFGDILVSGSTDRTVRIWNMKTGQQLHTFQGHTSTVRCLQILQPTKVGEDANGNPIMQPKEPLIITGSRDSTCRIWKLPCASDEPFLQATDGYNPYLVKVLTGHTNSVRAIAAHGDTLISGSYDSTVRVWRVSTGELVHRLEGHDSKVYSVVLDHKRNRCYSGSMDMVVKVWSIETGECLFDLRGHSSLVGLLDLKDDYLVSAAADATLRIWDPDTGKCRHRLSAHSGAITCFSHDSQKIISGSDSTLKMWSTQSGECIRNLLSDLHGVWQIRFDERRCVAAVQRHRWTYIEVMDFGAPRDAHDGRGARLGERIVVDEGGVEVDDEPDMRAAEQAAENTQAAA